jgi:hypothetical protein
VSEAREVDETHVRVVRVGHGANCSSIGSVIDTLFATAAVGASVFAAVVAAMAREDVRVVEPSGKPPPASQPPSPPSASSGSSSSPATSSSPRGAP